MEAVDSSSKNTEKSKNKALHQIWKRKFATNIVISVEEAESLSEEMQKTMSRWNFIQFKTLKTKHHRPGVLKILLNATPYI